MVSDLALNTPSGPCFRTFASELLLNVSGGLFCCAMATDSALNPSRLPCHKIASDSVIHPLRGTFLLAMVCELKLKAFSGSCRDAVVTGLVLNAFSRLCFDTIVSNLVLMCEGALLRSHGRRFGIKYFKRALFE